MNPAITAALIAADQQIEAPTPVQRLTKAGAVSSNTAIVIEPASPAEHKQLDGAIGRGFITRHHSGRFYVNPRAVAEHNQSIGYALLLGLLIAGSVIASVVALITFDG
ncbi:MAG: hypothetical protein LH465_07925 [Sphingomonas bacterium]|nr:hypothetical protein [Sphingomonas bacterium]